MWAFHHEQRADILADLLELGKVNLARIGAGAGNDQFRFVLARQPRDLVEVDALVIGLHA